MTESVSAPEAAEETSRLLALEAIAAGVQRLVEGVAGLEGRADAVGVGKGWKEAFKAAQAAKEAKGKRQLESRIRSERSANSYREANPKLAPHLADLHKELYGA